MNYGNALLGAFMAAAFGISTWLIVAQPRDPHAYIFSNLYEAREAASVVNDCIAITAVRDGYTFEACDE
jgi:hypothetical protein